MTLQSCLTIDLAAITNNWRALASRSGSAETAAVLKADAYGCGVAEAGPTLVRAGVTTFFVALPSEGVALRQAIGAGPAVYILGGYASAQAALFTRHDLRPVLNSLTQVREFRSDAPGIRAALQLDSGMNRLGLEAAEFSALGGLPEGVDLIMSHLACADAPDHPQNAAQLDAFHQMTAGLGVRRSLAATGGILLGPDYHFDLTRPGVGLYGGLPFAEAEPVVSLAVPILQIRDVAPGEAVGYGASWIAEHPARIATIGAGYADGLIRAASNRGHAWLGDTPLPFAGRVSMDLIGLDVTGAPEAREGALVELIGPHQSVDDLAEAASTIGYEVLTSLGSRYDRRYTGA